MGSLAYGTEVVDRVDKIVGPGNRYVTAAKMAVFGHVDIDSPAGPSESLILADDTANPLWTAIDEIPYDRMWPDDRIWLPLLLERRPFLGRFVFDGDAMLDHHLIER